MPTEDTPWHAAYPEPKNTSPDSVSRSDLLERLNRGEQPGRDFLLIDLRRNDHEVSEIYISTATTVDCVTFHAHDSLDCVG